MDSVYLSYAKALFSLQEENKKSNKDTLIALENIKKIFDSEIRKFLYSKAIKASEKKDVIKNSLKDFDEVVVSFIYVLIDNNRINVLDEIIESFKYLVSLDSGKVIVDVKSSKNLNKEELDKVKELIKNKFFENDFSKEVLINFIIDETLIKGIRIEYQNKALDYSYFNKQLSLKEYLEK